MSERICLDKSVSLLSKLYRDAVFSQWAQNYYIYTGIFTGE